MKTVKTNSLYQMNHEGSYPRIRGAFLSQNVSALMGECEKRPCQPLSWQAPDVASSPPWAGRTHNHTSPPSTGPLPALPCPALQAFPLIKSLSRASQLNPRPADSAPPQPIWMHAVCEIFWDSLSCHVKTAWESSSGGLIISCFTFEPLYKH